MFQPGALATKVVCLTQVVNADELQDDESYEDIVEDMRVEGGKFGNDLDVVNWSNHNFFFFFLLFSPVFPANHHACVLIFFVFYLSVLQPFVVPHSA